MYDRSQEPNEFVADSLEEARAKAAEFYGIAESELRVAVPTAGEVFGAAGRSVIVAVPKSVSARGPRRGADEGEEGGPRRDSRRGDREGRRERGERGGPRGRGGRRERGGERETVSADERPRSSGPPAVPQSKGTAQGELAEIGRFVQGAIERMKLGSFEISESEEGDFLIYQIRGAAAEELQRSGGRAADALQLITNQVAMRQSDDAPRIVVDLEAGGDDRENTLARLADRAIKRARETGRSIALDPMNPRDRRVVHLAVREEDGLATMSIGEGRYRQVLVVPEGAPEYDDAVEESSRA